MKQTKVKKRQKQANQFLENSKHFEWKREEKLKSSVYNCPMTGPPWRMKKLYREPKNTNRHKQPSPHITDTRTHAVLRKKEHVHLLRTHPRS